MSSLTLYYLMPHRLISFYCDFATGESVCFWKWFISEFNSSGSNFQHESKKWREWKDTSSTIPDSKLSLENKHLATCGNLGNQSSWTRSKIGVLQQLALSMVTCSARSSNWILQSVQSLLSKTFRRITSSLYTIQYSLAEKAQVQPEQWGENSTTKSKTWLIHII